MHTATDTNHNMGKTFASLLGSKTFFFCVFGGLARVLECAPSDPCARGRDRLLCERACKCEGAQRRNLCAHDADRSLGLDFRLSKRVCRSREYDGSVPAFRAVL